jgi:hypothetical protein
MEPGRAPPDEPFFNPVARCAASDYVGGRFDCAHRNYPPHIPAAAHARGSAHPFPPVHANGRRDVFSDFDVKKEGALATGHPRRHQRGVMSPRAVSSLQQALPFPTIAGQTVQASSTPFAQRRYKSF